MNRRVLISGLGAGATLASAAAARAASHPAARPAARPRDPFVVTGDGERLFVQDWGEGRPVVFVHGWSMSAAFWEYQVEALARQGLRCIAYDQRGCGRSSIAYGGYDLDTLADDLEAVLASRGLGEVVLVSHSMGSAQVARYLSRHGAGRIGKVALVACTTPTLDRAAKAPLLEQAMRTDRPKFLRDLAVPFFEPVSVSPQLVDWGIGIVLQASLHASIAYNRVNLEANLTRDLKSFATGPDLTTGAGGGALPTLVIHGSADASSPLELTGARTAALIPGAKLVVYEGAPHGLPLTHAERLNRDLLDFARS